MSETAVDAREQLLAAIRRELMGPDPRGSELAVPFAGDPVDEYEPYVEAGSREEILAVQMPLQRYGVGVLFPKDSTVEDAETEEDGTSDADWEGEEDLDDSAASALATIARRRDQQGSNDPDTATADLVDTTRRQASSMAVSFRLRSHDGLTIRAVLPRIEPGTEFAVNGRYESFDALGLNPETKAVSERTWWVRRPLTGEASFAVPVRLEPGTATRLKRVAQRFEGLGPLELEFTAFARRYPDGEPNDLIVTVVLANRTTVTSKTFRDHLCVFQAYFEVEGPGTAFVALPGARVTDRAAASLELLYAKSGTMAIGHGCAADWRDELGRKRIIATHFPVFEAASMTPELKTADGRSLSVSMAKLAGLTEVDDPYEDLKELVSLYRDWLSMRRQELDGFTDDMRATAAHHVVQATAMLERMERGLRLVETDRSVAEAFKLMNHAMFLQQIRSKLPARRFVPATKVEPARFESPFPPVDAVSLPPNIGFWRPFQIGFIIAAIESVAYHTAPERAVVDLVWFPTGGGKTEAYLGLTAFSGFLRRLRDPEDAGTDVLMRYTLRLLTAQQFQRASALVCAMDYLRRKDEPSLGRTSFSIGLWAGESVTPNSWQEAVKSLRDLTDGKSTRNPFLVTSCPWCGAEMGLRKRGRQPYVLGYLKVPGRVKIHCPDRACDFHAELPVRVVDEDLYERPPTVVIGTVDKFAQLAWNSRPRTLFGLTARGQRVASPPNLAIQDELHLITGPLGTMVGAYETVVEHLCRYEARDGAVPKIVCSTATIRNYIEQVRWLFAREDTRVFPPPMFDIDDSFFGVRARNDDGSPAPGRKYVGVYGSALGSHMAVQVRAYAAALQGVMELPEAHRDPYWTLLGFFNSLRDLGSTTTLLQDQIQHQLKAMWRRANIMRDEDREKRRYIRVPEELTGRLRSEEVPLALEKLTRKYGERSDVVDVCLASNIIEVGIDVDRLGLMVVTGQPKTTAQYIQVTGRVGRDWRSRPGLVLVVYSPNRARDRSVFETFRSNHERMYAAVEPASVTPFSLPALRRTLHAVMIAFLRQTFPEEEVQTPDQVDLDELESFRALMIERIRVVDPAAAADFNEVFEERIRSWRLRRPMRWNNWQDEDDQEVLMVPAGGPEEVKGDMRWRTPQSLRNVDAECLVDTRIATIVEHFRVDGRIGER